MSPKPVGMCLFDASCTASLWWAPSCHHPEFTGKNDASCSNNWKLDIIWASDLKFAYIAKQLWANGRVKHIPQSSWRCLLWLVLLTGVWKGELSWIEQLGDRTAIDNSWSSLRLRQELYQTCIATCICVCSDDLQLMARAVYNMYPKVLNVNLSCVQVITERKFDWHVS